MQLPPASGSLSRRQIAVWRAEEMTQMLASVTGVQEAEIAIAGGADIIDLKDPTAGALGAVSIEGIVGTVAAVAGRRATSAVCGDLPMQPETLSARAGEVASTGVDFVKVGFFRTQQAVACAASLASVAARTKLIAVLFADLEIDFDLLPVLARHDFHGVMVDTADKSRGRLLDHLPPEQIPSFVDRARSHGLRTGLSGSLEEPDIPRLLPFEPDFLGFRGALCSGARTVSIDPKAVARIRALIPDERGTGRSAGVDYRLLAARGYSPDAADAALGTDRIFIRDFVLPVRIGAYSFEHGHTQKVRFDVSADVLRLTENPEDMRHVFSYDIIMDGIRAIVGRGHVELSETLAGQIAARVLEDSRVMRVTVRVEKLELGAGGVGVEIERKRPRPRASSVRTGQTPGRGPAEPAGGRQGGRS
jgi:dihydroneopterin aldolase